MSKVYITRLQKYIGIRIFDFVWQRLQYLMVDIPWSKNFNYKIRNLFSNIKVPTLDIEIKGLRKRSDLGLPSHLHTFTLKKI